MSDGYDTAPSMMENTNVGPSFGANYASRSTTPESASEPSTTGSYATAAEDNEDRASMSSGMRITLRVAPLVLEDSNDQDPPEYDEHDNVPQYDDARQPGGLPQIPTNTGGAADLTTTVREFENWDDYKIICLSGPQVTVVLEEAGGDVSLTCSHKLLKDFSREFGRMNAMVFNHMVNLTDFFQDLAVKSVARTFIHLYEMMQAGGIPVPISGDISFMRLIDMYVMAYFLDMPWAKDWITVYVRAKIEELATNWHVQYNMACMLEDNPDDDAAHQHRGHHHRRHGHDNLVLPIPRKTPLQQQAAKLLDIQEAYLATRINPRADVCLPSQLARLVAEACPAELRLRVEAAGDLRNEFTVALQVFGLQRNAEVRRGLNAGQGQ